MFTLAISCLSTFNLLWFMDLTVSGSYAVLFFIASYFTFTTRPIQIRTSSQLWLSLFILYGAISLLFSNSILDVYWRDIHHSVLYLFSFSHCSWGSLSKNSEVICIPFSSEPRFVEKLLYFKGKNTLGTCRNKKAESGL